jgi:hypothetical protein
MLLYHDYVRWDTDQGGSNFEKKLLGLCGYIMITFGETPTWEVKT